MSSSLHFLIIPLMCPGHLIPMVDMAKLIAQHSVTVTIVITPRNAERYGSVLHRAIASGLPIKILQLEFPASEHGLPDGCESVDDLPTFNLTRNFIDAFSALQKPLEDVFNMLKPRPSCIISDKHLTWTAEVANKFQIPWVIFDGMSCFTQLVTHNLCVSRIHETLADSDRLILPGLPDNISMTKSQLPGLFNPGHLIPMVDMAKLIAQLSVTVTIVITPRNAERYGSVLHRAIASGLPIKILQLEFPASEHGLPDGCESVDDLPTFNLTRNFFDAFATLQKPLEDVFNMLEPRPSCIISDKHLTWTAEVANKFQIPWVIFDGMSCFTQLVTHNLCVSKIHETLADSDRLILPGLPDTISMTKSQLPGLFNPGNGARAKDILSAREKIRAAELGAYGTIINSFDEMETRYIDDFKKLKQGKVWCIGPFSNSNKNDLDRAQRGSKDSVSNHEYMKWLDSQHNRSVIYACLGSLTRLTPLQFIELALGLENSKFPFILVVKGGKRTEEIEKWLDETEFESRVKERGVLIRGWASQVLILSHPAVGAFLTHCGWNSTIEGVCAGVPLITWPQFAEQFLNERLVVQVLGTGVAVGAKRVIHLEEEDGGPMQVSREDVCKAVKIVMGEGEDGDERRRKAKCLKQMAEKAIEEGGSSQFNLNLFTDDIRLHTVKGLIGN